MKESLLLTDLYFKKGSDRIAISIYTTSLLMSSSQKKSIIYSQGLSLKRNCTFEKGFIVHLLDMKEWIFARGYPQKMVKEQMKGEVFGKTDKTREDYVSFLLLYSILNLRFLAKKIKELSKYLHRDLEAKAVFTPAPMVSFRSVRKIKDYLVRAKLHPLERNVDSRKCSQSRCEKCNIESTDLFSSTVNGETYKINHHFNCDSKCLAYLIICRTFKLQYTGETLGIVGTITVAVLEKQRE